MMEQIISTSSNPGDLVLDCFAGSGTTLAAAGNLGRRWIGIDKSEEAIAATINRLRFGSQPMGDYVAKKRTLPKELNLELFGAPQNVQHEAADNVTREDFCLYRAESEPLMGAESEVAVLKDKPSNRKHSVSAKQIIYTTSKRSKIAANKPK